jgi:hypothetical protein
MFLVFWSRIVNFSRHKIHDTILNKNYYLRLVWIFYIYYYLHLVGFFNKIFWRYSPSLYIFVYHIDTWYINVYRHYIHECTHSSRFKPKTSWRCTKAFTTKPLHDFDDFFKKLTLLSLTWNYWKNSNFNIQFFFKIYSNFTNEKMVFELIQ